VGGERADYTMLASVEIYDPKTDAVTVAAPLPEPRVHHTATLLPSGEVKADDQSSAKGPSFSPPRPVGAAKSEVASTENRAPRDTGTGHFLGSSSCEARLAEGDDPGRLGRAADEGDGVPTRVELNGSSRLSHNRELPFRAAGSGATD